MSRTIIHALCALLCLSLVACGDDAGGGGTRPGTDAAVPDATVEDASIVTDGSTIQVLPLSTVTSIRAGWRHACALKSDGTTWCWGHNTSGQLGDDTLVSRPWAAPMVFSEKVDELSCGGWHTCVQAGSKLYCTGENRNGQLGIHSRDRSLTPSEVPREGFSIPTLGLKHSCALRESFVVCWGHNGWGQLGVNDTTDRLYPDTNAMMDAPSIGTGDGHSCVVQPDGTLKCMGTNIHGQLGTNDLVSRPLATLVPGLADVHAVTAGESHSCAIHRSDNDVSCWGHNGYGQLGHVGNSKRVPTASDAPSGITQISARTHHTCAVSDAGELLCWGDNRAGELGRGGATEDPEPTPTVVGGVGTVSMVATGANFTCALTTEGSVYCWGRNDLGQLGVGDNEPRLEPTPVVQLAE